MQYIVDKRRSYFMSGE